VTNDAPTKSALVVDDMSVMRRSVANLLRSQGFAPVDEVSSGPDALNQIAAAGGYDLVISDWNMDPMTGLEVLTTLKSDDRFQAVTFILMTAEPSPEKQAAAEAAGVSGFLVKPFSASDLNSEIERVFGET
jgi:two-component system chemotaxis response regulator CheY